MSRTCLLQTSGYRVLFELKDLETTTAYVDMVVEFQLDPCLGGSLVKSEPTFVAMSDLQRLLAYFDQHIAYLQQDPDSESDIFVPLELGFQVQALSGEVRSQCDGEFSIRFMVNVGKSKDEDCRVYVGGESVVTLEQIKNFTSLIHGVMAELGASKSTNLP